MPPKAIEVLFLGLGAPTSAHEARASPHHRSTVLLTAVLAGLLTWLRVGDDAGDGAVVLPLLALPAGAVVGYFIGLAVNRE